MATTALIPVEQYLRSNHDPDAEFVDGVIEERAVGELDHATWQQAIEMWFLQHMHAWNIRVRCELRVQVSSTRYRVPDVVVWDRSLPKERILTHPPLAVFEVLSTEDTHTRLMHKLADYEAMGVRNIFVVQPEGARVYRFAEGSLVAGPAESPLVGNPGVVDWPAIAALRDE